jgi:putative phage-type endonuclease
MLILDCKQGSEEWLEARRGIPTSSCFSQIITPTGNISSSWDLYLNKLLAEYTDPQFSVEDRVYTKEMKRGNELEPEARALYEMMTGDVVDEVGGLYLDEDRNSLCSPDGIVFKKKNGLEIKCPKLSTHFKWIREFEKHGEMPKEHFVQVQTAMAFSGFSSWDFMSYHPAYKPHLISVQADAEFIKKIISAVKFFINELNQEKAKIDLYKNEEFR